MFRKVLIKVIAVFALAAPAVSPALAATRVAPTSGTTSHRADTRKYQHERQEIEEIRDKSFPKLGSKYEVLGPATPKYNCIAWSLGVTTRWVWPGTSMSSFDDLDSQYGFRRVKKMDYSVQTGIEKVVLYGKWTNGKFEATHQCKQMSDGTWTSKLGKMALIRHASPESLDGPDYGVPVAVYTRKKVG
jgi:hypothetical protein